MRGLIGGRDDVDQDDGRRKAKRLVPLACFLVLCLILGIWTGINLGRGGSEPQKAAAASSQRVRKTRRVPKDGDQAIRLNAPKAWPKTAERVVKATLGWSKEDNVERPVSQEALMKAGMDRSRAASYTPIWPSVFRPATSADLDASGARLSVMSGATEGDDLDYVVTVSLAPSWTDRQGRVAHVRPGEAEWTVTIDHATGRAKAVKEPDPQWLWFALPQDGLVPSTGVRQ